MSEGLSCPICLLADEPGSMVAVNIERNLSKQPMTVKLCRTCAAAIAQASAAQSEPPPAEIPAAADELEEGK